MFKTILVHVDETARFAQRIEVATRFAKQYEAHLVGAAMTGLSAFMFPVGGYPVGMPEFVFPVDELRAQATRALDRFDMAARAAGVNSYERRTVDEEAGVGCALHARYSDVVIISQSEPGNFRFRVRSDFPEYVLLHSSRPVLILPDADIADELGGIVTVAWNGSAEAVRAITTAIPVLQRAQLIYLVVVDADRRADAHGGEPGADMALYLARHGNFDSGNWV